MCVCAGFLFSPGAPRSDVTLPAPAVFSLSCQATGVVVTQVI